ncbi:MAG: DUF4190 domain-containing protein [Marmoricola sp.]
MSQPPPPQHPGYGYYPPPPPRETSGKAVAALVLGILAFVSCGPFTAIPAIFVGRSAMRDVDASQGRLQGRGMATAGFVLGILGTVLFAILIALVIIVVVIGLSSTDCHNTGGSGNYSFQCS